MTAVRAQRAEGRQGAADTEQISDQLERRRVGRSPYKGIESYRPEDGALFYGRDAETRSLVSLVLASRFCVVHAASGAGKSSLLNAQVMPELERCGWIPVRTTPQDEPTRALRVAVVLNTLPRPDAERHALGEILTSWATDSEPTLDHLRQHYLNLEPKDVRKRAWIAPYYALLSQSERDRGRGEWGEYTPYICRMLRAGWSPEEYGRYLGGLLRCGHAVADRSTDPRPITGETPLPALVDLLSDPSIDVAYRALLELVDVPSAGLTPLFDRLFHVWWNFFHGPLRLVLVVDQFEEIFTRFTDTRRTQQLPGTPIRHQQVLFFEHLRRLYGATELPWQKELPREDSRQLTESPSLSIRYLLSMRDEWVAQLDRLRAFVPELALYHLTLVRREEAEEVIIRPSRFFGMTLPSALATKIADDQLREGQYIEPSQVQIICESVWGEGGEATGAPQAVPRDTAGDPELKCWAETLDPAQRDDPFVARFIRQGGSHGILSAYFRRVLTRYCDEDQLTILELLTPLITAEGTRNIAPRASLINAPFREQVRRRELLEGLENTRIVRGERRGDDLFVEITHEFLIPSIREEIRLRLVRDIEYRRFREAERKLAMYDAANFKAPLDKSARTALIELLPTLTADEFRALDTKRERLRLQAWPWAGEVMLRNAVCHAEDAATVRRWTDAYQPWSPAFEDLARRAAGDWSPASAFDRAELRVLRQAGGGSTRPGRPHEDRAEEQGEMPDPNLLHAFALKSALLYAGDADRDLVRFWLIQTEPPLSTP